MTADKREMTDRERYAAQQLASCTFTVGSYNKRFARDMASITRNNGQVTEKQVANLWRLVYRYRRQIKDKELVAEAERLKPAERPKASYDNLQKLQEWSKAAPVTAIPHTLPFMLPGIEEQ